MSEVVHATWQTEFYGRSKERFAPTGMQAVSSVNTQNRPLMIT